MLKHIYIYLSLIFVLLLSACQKEYTCTCTSIPKNKDTIVDKVKTTKVGSKGYKKFCADFENQHSDLKDCHL